MLDPTVPLMQLLIFIDFRQFPPEQLFLLLTTNKLNFMRKKNKQWNGPLLNDRGKPDNRFFSEGRGVQTNSKHPTCLCSAV